MEDDVIIYDPLGELKKLADEIAKEEEKEKWPASTNNSGARTTRFIA